MGFITDIYSLLPFLKGPGSLSSNSEKNPENPAEFITIMSNSNSEDQAATASSSEIRANLISHLFPPTDLHQSQPKPKRKRSQPGNPDPDAEVIALSPRSLMATNRFVCEICNKGFQRDQNLQLHRRGHNLPWKLRQRSINKDDEVVVRKRVYVCPEVSCAHHQPSRALGDLTGIKKHYCRKHGEKKWKCEKCSKRYAVQSDWKAHVKNCGTREYRCDCGILFARKDSFITHRAFCDALAEESARLTASTTTTTTTTTNHSPPPFFLPFLSSLWDPLNLNPNLNPNPNPNPNPTHLFHVKLEDPLIIHPTTPSLPYLSATELLHQASLMGPTSSSSTGCHVDRLVGPMFSSSGLDPCSRDASTWQVGADKLTRDFLGVAAGEDEEELMSANFGLGLSNDDECPCFL